MKTESDILIGSDRDGNGMTLDPSLSSLPLPFNTPHDVEDTILTLAVRPVR